MGIKQWDKTYIDCGIHIDNDEPGRKWYWWITWNSSDEQRSVKLYDDEEDCVNALEDFLYSLSQAGRKFNITK